MNTNAELITYASRDEWLLARQSYIGGSDAACIIGANPWKNNVALWEEKRKLRIAEDVSDNPLVLYGIRAEEHLRELFRWDYPNMAVFYEENNLWWNDRCPWAHASLDGWLVDEKGRNGILEIKTATISGSSQKAKWADRIPQNYYIQVLHYLMVTEFDFAILKAQLKYEIPGQEVFLKTQHYRIERADAESDIEYLREKEEEFAECLNNGIKPALILPKI